MDTSELDTLDSLKVDLEQRCLSAEKKRIQAPTSVSALTFSSHFADVEKWIQFLSNSSEEDLQRALAEVEKQHQKVRQQVSAMKDRM
mmetsp:Transcript_3386/g.6647  ORF Transcript_3386/g.6647 Transcript_3386/m.6647 type:complete len:87 (+) Transcript_3386:74-334(+)